MAQKSYGIENLAFRDSSRTDDYNLERVQGSSTFVMPANMAECSYMFPSQLTEMICTDTLKERENDTYSQKDVDKKIEDLNLEITDMITKATANATETNGKAETVESLFNIGGVAFIPVDTK